MTTKKLKVLLGKPGLDGHDVGVKVLGHALVNEGINVVYSGLRKSIEQIVQMAIKNKVDVIGISILSGTHLVLCEQMSQEMMKANLSIPWIVGGNIPDNDIETIKSLGATAAFPTGTTIKEAIDYFNRFADTAKKC